MAENKLQHHSLFTLPLGTLGGTWYGTAGFGIWIWRFFAFLCNTRVRHVSKLQLNCHNHPQNLLLFIATGVLGNLSVFTGTRPAATAAAAVTGRSLVESWPCSCDEEEPPPEVPGGMIEAPAGPYGEPASIEESDTPTCGSQWFRRMLMASSKRSSMRVPWNEWVEKNRDEGNW